MPSITNGMSIIDGIVIIVVTMIVTGGPIFASIYAARMAKRATSVASEAKTHAEAANVAVNQTTGPRIYDNVETTRREAAAGRALLEHIALEQSDTRRQINGLGERVEQLAEMSRRLSERQVEILARFDNLENRQIIIERGVARH